MERPTRYACRCCGFLTLTDPATFSYELCPVCFWQSDPVQNEDSSYSGGANEVSLNSGRENYIVLGACAPCFSEQARSPYTDEIPRPPVLLGLDAANRTTAIRGTKIVMLGVVRAMLSGHLSIGDGCAALASLSFPFDEIERTTPIFNIVAHDMDEFPTGTVRTEWSDEALKKKDKERVDYESRIRPKVEDACRLLENYLLGDLAPRPRS